MVIEDTNVLDQESQGGIVRIPLPNATAVLVLGILSIVLGCCFTPVGLIIAIIALILGQRDMQLFRQNPDKYEEKSYKNLNAGRITALIGLIISLILLVFTIMFFSNQEFWEAFQKGMEQAQQQ